MPVATDRRNRIGIGTLAILFFIAFALGAGVMYYLSRGGSAGNGAGDLFSMRMQDPPAANRPLGATSRIGAPVPTDRPASGPVNAAVVRQTAERVEQVEAQTGGIDQRVAALEQRITRLDLQSQAAAGYAARAEGMLIAFATRRAIERGQRLGFLEDQLRLRFGEARPNAVQTVIDASRDPVTLDQLLVQLDTIGSGLVEMPGDAGILSRLRHELSQLFRIRTADTPSSIASERLARARSHLEGGRVERAIAEIRAMPNAPLASEWLERASRYAETQRALEVLEAVAIYETRDLRDGDGQPVNLPGLAE